MDIDIIKQMFGRCMMFNYPILKSTSRFVKFEEANKDIDTLRRLDKEKGKLHRQKVFGDQP